MTIFTIAAADLDALAAYGLIPMIVGLVFAIISLIAAICILKKAGFSGWLVLLYFIPIVNVIFYLYFAFAKWPVQKRLEAAQAGAAAAE